MKKIMPYICAVGLLAGIASYDAASQTKQHHPNVTLDERVSERDGRGFVKGTIVDIDEDSFLIEKHQDIIEQYDSFKSNSYKKDFITSGNYIFETITVKAGKKLVRLIHLGPSNFTKGEKVEFDYEVAPHRRLALNQLLHADNFLGYEGKINAQSGFIRTDGIIKMLEEWNN